MVNKIATLIAYYWTNVLMLAIFESKGASSDTNVLTDDRRHLLLSWIDLYNIKTLPFKMATSLFYNNLLQYFRKLNITKHDPKHQNSE